MEIPGVSENRRYLAFRDGRPFFYLADTAWALFQRLSREETVRYLDNRAKKGFSVIQACLLSELRGLSVPNAYGNLPLEKDAAGRYDPLRPDLRPDGYWDHVRWVLREARKRNLYVALLPTWGDKFNRSFGYEDEIFTGENAREYGRWVGATLGDAENIFWVLGGDRPLVTDAHFKIIGDMARGIREAEPVRHLMTFHPPGEKSSSDFVHEEPWLDFNMLQTGHCRKTLIYRMVEKDYLLDPTKPVINGEPRYEMHPESFLPEHGFMDAVDCRYSAWESVLSGSCGHTYGNHAVWGFWDWESIGRFPFKPNYFCCPWQDALDSPGSYQMQYLATICRSLPFETMHPLPELATGQTEGELHVPVLGGGGCIAAYSPYGLPVSLDRQGTEKTLDASSSASLSTSWANPKNGAWTEGTPPRETAGEWTFVPPSSGRGEDWVLVLRRT